MHGYLVPAREIFAAGAATFFAIVGSIFALAAIFALIAPMFRSPRDFLAALKVATYGSIPVLLAGGTLLLPAMAIVGMAGLCHTLFLYWLGVHHVLKVPAGGSPSTSASRSCCWRSSRCVPAPPAAPSGCSDAAAVEPCGRPSAPDWVHYAPAPPPGARLLSIKTLRATHGNDLPSTIFWLRSSSS